MYVFAAGTSLDKCFIKQGAFFDLVPRLPGMSFLSSDSSVFAMLTPHTPI